MDMRKFVNECLRPKNRFYIMGHTILIHRKDLNYGNGWGLVKLSLLIKSQWAIRVYDNDVEYVMKRLQEDISGVKN